MNNLLLIGGLLFAYHYFTKNGNPLKTNPLISQMPQDSSIFPLKVGDQNDFVKNIQAAILNKGGTPADYILKAGGANGYFSALMETALRVLGLPAQIDETTYRQLIQDSTIVRNVAFVDDVKGANLYTSVGDSYLPGYGYGRDLIIQLPYKTYLGTATGNYKNGMLEIATTINTRRIKFWVSTQFITLVSDEEYQSLKKTRIIEKSVQAKNRLLKS